MSPHLSNKQDYQTQMATPNTIALFALPPEKAEFVLLCLRLYYLQHKENKPKQIQKKKNDLRRSLEKRR
ncbi:hypothetical protein CEXT_755201 [Caerostris extrusa]|uniref:Uncharacterized protein n=1 Tax=Caerostris extrusa TaxID=172846 RepID=A0AAV4NNE9_CAEEX|nr:hypothetical protein CEXT_755201 [Caerostris extrusa]